MKRLACLPVLGFLVWLGLRWVLRNNTLMALDKAPFRFEAAVRGPIAPLARQQTYPFCSPDMLVSEPLQTGLLAVRPKRSQLRFYLADREPLELSLKVRMGVAYEEEVNFLINQHGWKSTRLNKDWVTLQGMVPPEWLQSGRNFLGMTVESGLPIEFGDLTIRPAEVEMPGTFESEGLRLGWGSHLAVAVQSGGWPQLLVNSMELDSNPGAAIPQQAALRLLYQAPGLEWSRQFSLSGGPLRISLPHSPSGWGKLQFEARCSAPLLPGQRGIILRNPRLAVRQSAGPAIARPGQPLANIRRPNVVLYLIDTLRPDHLGCYGKMPSPSPNLDAFARDAVLFEDGCAQSGWTKPSTASIMSSQWPWRHRVQDYKDVVPADLPWLAEELQRGGYNTAGVVSNSLAGHEFGFDRGYDSFITRNKSTSEEAHLLVEQWFASQRVKDKPFFLYVHTLDPHSPYMHSSTYRNVPRVDAEQMDKEPIHLGDAAQLEDYKRPYGPDIRERLERRLADYDREIQNNDANFGKLMAWLKQQHLYEDSLIIVLSDHGEEFLEHGRVGHVNSLFQELVHIPLIIKFPANQGAGMRVKEAWQQLDVAPTILNACGLTPPKSFQGVAYQPGISPPVDRPCLFSIQAGRDVPNFGDNSIRPLFVNLQAIRRGNWVYQRVISGAPGRFEPELLFNLTADPGQYHNQSERDPGRALSLSLELDSLFHPAVQVHGPRTPESDRKLLELLRSLQYVR
jgi:arylsulfatase A-like enzyme